MLAVPEPVLYVTICDDYPKRLLQPHVVIVAFISAQSVGIVSSLKRAATCIKGGETEKLCLNNPHLR